MDSCVAVEKEIDRVINRFTAINEHSSQVIGDVVNQILELKNHLEEGKHSQPLPARNSASSGKYFVVLIVQW